MKQGTQGIAYEFLVRLTIAIVLVITAIVIAQRLFSVSQGALASFEGLSNKIGKLGPEDSSTHTLRMDETAAVIGFVQNSEELTFQYDNNKFQAKYLRPAACPSGKACLCLCPGGFIPEVKLSCKKTPICRTFSTINFHTPIQKADFISQNVVPDIDYSFGSGFIIRRYTGGNLPGIRESSIALTLQRIGNVVYVCDHQPCMKKDVS